MKTVINSNKGDLTAFLFRFCCNHKKTIIDAVCALDFNAYAKKEKCDDVNKFEIEFEDASEVRVSREDFIKYHLQYTMLALEIEAKFLGIWIA